MPLPKPVPGLVIRYVYLWHDEHLRQRESGSKDRPCMVVVAVQREGGATLVTVAPITSKRPKSNSLAVELSLDTKKRLGLDDTGPSWIVTHDINTFTWPGPDVRRVARSERFAYGLVPEATF